MYTLADLVPRTLLVQVFLTILLPPLGDPPLESYLSLSRERRRHFQLLLSHPLVAFSLSSRSLACCRACVLDFLRCRPAVMICLSSCFDSTSLFFMHRRVVPLPYQACILQSVPALPLHTRSWSHVGHTCHRTPESWFDVCSTLPAWLCNSHLTVPASQSLSFFLESWPR